MSARHKSSWGGGAQAGLKIFWRRMELGAMVNVEF